uniref:Uncharacterized protein n=1 Tax=Anguilla anguilla TaxID=7936 RepID=A0A0E9T3C1_ANGAN
MLSKRQTPLLVVLAGSITPGGINGAQRSV